MEDEDAHFQKEEQSESFYSCVRCAKTSFPPGCLAQQEYWSDLRAGTGTLFFPHRIQSQHSQAQLHQEDSLFFVEGMLMAPLVTSGVDGGVAQELQMPSGPQALEALLIFFRAVSAQLDAVPESALVQSVRRISRTCLSTSRTVENPRSGARTSV